MARPYCCRRVRGNPVSRCFQPTGKKAGAQDEVVMTLDELEALRLADLEGHYHEQAARSMDISRPTFGRILEAGRRKVAQALVQGLRLRIEGGPVSQIEETGQRCEVCCRLRDPAGDPARGGGCAHCRRERGTGEGRS